MPKTAKMPVPYLGDEPYIFLSYSHRNAEQANAFIRSMNRAGFRIWYDEGLIPGREWDDTIARVIMHCSYFIALLTEDSLSITECAFMAGFQSTTTFNKVFLESMGCSPREYRKLHYQPTD